MANKAWYDFIRGKTYDEIYGREKGRAIVEKRRKTLKKVGWVPPAKLWEGHTYEERYGKKKAEAIIQKQIVSHLGQRHPNSILALERANCRGKTYAERYGKEGAARVLEKISRPIELKWRDKKKAREFKEAQRVRMTAVAHRVAKMNSNRKMNGWESRVLRVISKYRLGFVYTGDGKSVRFGGKYPDFYNKNTNTIIEVFCRSIKNNRYGSYERYKRVRRAFAKRYSLRIIFIDDAIMARANQDRFILKAIRGD